jgi:hypothetical protein
VAAIIGRNDRIARCEWRLANEQVPNHVVARLSPANVVVSRSVAEAIAAPDGLAVGNAGVPRSAIVLDAVADLALLLVTGWHALEVASDQVAAPA